MQVPSLLEAPYLLFHDQFRVLKCLSGMRVSHHKTRLPLVGRLSQRVWAITAMGSRGLLYHSMLGKKLSEAILADDDTLIPMEVRICS